MVGLAFICDEMLTLLLSNPIQSSLWQGFCTNFSLAVVEGIVHRLVLIRYQPPIHWDDFERMVRDLFQEHLKIPIDRLGRSGQKQHGIDLYGFIRSTEDQKKILRALGLEESEISKALGVQCKCYEHDLSYEVIRKDHDAALHSSELKISAIIVATTVKRDAKLQAKLASKKHELPLLKRVLFWEDIQELLNKYQTIAQFHYPPIIEQDRLDYVERALFRRNFEDAISILDSEQLKVDFRKLGIDILKA